MTIRTAVTGRILSIVLSQAIILGAAVVFAAPAFAQMANGKPSNSSVG